MFAHDMEFFQKGLDILREALLYRAHAVIDEEDGWEVHIYGLTEKDADIMFEWLNRFCEDGNGNIVH